LFITICIEKHCTRPLAPESFQTGYFTWAICHIAYWKARCFITSIHVMINFRLFKKLAFCVVDFILYCTSFAEDWWYTETMHWTEMYSRPVQIWTFFKSCR